MQEYFRISRPSVHQMVLTLERAGLKRAQILLAADAGTSDEEIARSVGVSG